MNTVTASLLFYILPFLLGLLFTNRVILAYIYGIISTFMLFVLAWCFSLAFHTNLTYYVPILIIILSLVALYYRMRSLKIFKSHKLYPHLIPYFYTLLPVLLVTSGVYFLIWKSATPYPLVLNWDIYEHLTATNQIVQGNFRILPSQFSDTFTFNSYTSLFYTLLAVPTMLMKASTLGMYWWLEYWHYLLVIITSFLLGQSLFKNHLIATLSALTSAFVFESSIAYTSLFLLPQTLAGVIGVLLIIEINNQPTKWPKIALACLGLFLLHFIIGFLLLTIILVWEFSPKIFNQKKLLIACLFILIASVIMNLIGHWTLTSREEATHFNLALLDKANLIINWYGFLGILAGLSIIISFVKRSELVYKIAAITLLLLAISIAPFSYFLKFFVLTHFFLCLLIAVGIYYLLENMTLPIKLLGILWITGCLFVIFYINQSSFKEPFYYKSYYSELSNNEIETADWLSENYDKSTQLISDPATQYILESLSGLNSQGGAYMDTHSRQILTHINPLETTTQIKSQLSHIQDNLSKQTPTHRLFIISGRYMEWQRLPQDQKMSTYYNIWRPYIINTDDYPYIDEFSNKFKVVYQNNEMIILEI